MPRLGTTVLLMLLIGTPRSALAEDAKAVEFFEKRIRPVLVEQCLSCHSAEAEGKGKLRGGLRLDSHAGWSKGGDTGAAIVPGKPGEGTLLKALKFDGDVQMPPKGKLPASVVADFEQWIRDGAIDPRSEAPAAKPAAGIDLEAGRRFWSLQPIASPKVPAVKIAGFQPANDVDAFLAAAWKEKGLKPVAEADRRTLVRRAYLDLLGLPPTPEEVDAFVNDNDPAAWTKLVDQLLANPHHGERWGRYWLDVARYAEDQAHTFGVKPKQNAYQYRDWVVAAFNSDMPFNRFVTLQLAGDLVPADGMDPFTRLAGLGFLGLGAEYYKNTAREQAIAEELDDRVDTVTRGFLGLTVSCARCHDHKFDPVPTRDYYSLAGIFNGSNLAEIPLAPPEVVQKYNEAQAQVKQAEAEATKFLTGVGRQAAADAAASTAKYMKAVRTLRTTKAKIDQVAKSEGLHRFFLDRWMKYLDASNASKAPATFKDWFALKSDASPEAVAKVADAVQTALVDLDVPDLPGGKRAKAIKRAKGITPLAKAMFLDQTAPLLVTPEQAEKQFLTDADRGTLKELRAEIDRRKAASPPAPPMAPALTGGGQSMKVYIRGNPATKGEDAPRGFLQVLAKSGTSPDFTRLDLANAITDPANPLTPRVIVNRVWAWHFGRGLVNTPSNFGKLGDRPSHPELLEHLTAGFLRNGQSLKWLHRQIMGSKAYRLSCDSDDANRKIDAANVYLWHSQRKRLDIESWRDSLLSVSGALDPTMGGPTFDLKDANARRRTVYAKVSRHNLDGLLRLFDFPDANVTADRRTVTTVPQQQLFALNSDFVVNQAKLFAKRLDKAATTDAARITEAYRLAFGRTPEPGEVEFGLTFLKRPGKPDDKLTRWEQYTQALLTCNEMMYVD